MTLNAILFGNQSLTIQCGDHWLSRGHTLAHVVTRDGAVAAWAQGKGIDVQAPGAGLADRLTRVDWLLSIAYLSLIPADVLALAGGAVNFHDGPLPKHAGLNAPVWAMLEGDQTHGITWHMVTPGVDEGDILVQRTFEIGPAETALTLNTKCYEQAIGSFPAVVEQLEHGAPNVRPQDLGQRTEHQRADRPSAFGLLDWSRNAADLARMVRALDHGDYANPLTTPKIRAGGVFRVLSAELATGTGAPGTVLATDPLTIACGTGALRLELDDMPEVQVGDTLPPLTASDRLDLDEAQAAMAAQEPKWRKALAAMHPVALPFAQSGAADHRSRALTLKTTPDRAAALAALWALRAAGEETAALAWRGPKLAKAPAGFALPWVPVTAEAIADATVEAMTTRLAETLARAEAQGPIAADLIARDPALDGTVPAIGIRRDGGTGLIPGTVLTVVLTDTDATLAWDAGRLPQGMAELMAERLDALATAEPSTLVRDLPTMAKAERELVLHGWNRTGKPYDPACIHTLFEAQVARTPDATAVVFEGTALTYAQLNTRANRAAHVLRDMGVAPGTLVGLSTPRSLEMLIGALAILKAGGAYVPMDPAYPAERVALFIEDSAAPVIVTTSATALPAHSAQALALDTDPRLGAAPDTNPASGVGPADLAYMIYTSGSTGRPKGVMVEHRNVANFFAGMDDRIPHEGGTWLSVTSLNFDISVLELFYTLARGFKLVLSSDENRALVSSGQLGTSDRGMEFSLYYWGNDDGKGRDKYRSLLEGAQFADTHGFTAVWTPERHFHAFGGPYPNPSVTGAAVAAVTQNLSVRAGSCVAPLHHTARIAEEWAVIDNLTNGRAGLAIASGWQPDDFVLRPENTPPANKPAMYDQIRDLRKLWAGEEVEFAKADGTKHGVVTQPRPVSDKLPIWVTTAGNPDTWREAGEIGANVLTHLLGQSVDEVAGKIGIYRAALAKAGHDPDAFTVTLMLHTYLADTREEAERIAREPMKDYLRSAAGLIKQYAWAFPAFKKPKNVDNAFQLDLGVLTEDELEAILDFAFLRYFEESGLFGTVDDAVARVEQLKTIGVDEVACLIDYGIPVRQVLDGLRPLAKVVERTNRVGTIPDDDFSIAAQILRHGVSHLQCTPSMARMIAMNPEAAHALSRVQTLMLGGEPLPGALVRDFARHTRAHVENMYGPTETTIWSSTENAKAGDGVVNIGTPIANTQFYVLDNDQQPVPVGVPGELWIGGDGVTRGYWQREDLTAERFRPDPFRGQGRMYRTGDLVRWRADGRIDFIGRADFQVKLRGYRIELGEIEAALEAAPGVAQAVVAAREDVPGDMRLVGYIRGTASESALKSALAAQLPAHMVPARIVTLDSFPLTPNRKVDRNALPAPSDVTLAQPEADVPTSDEGIGDDIATRIAAVWRHVLGVARVTAKDNFFDLGGHSLLAVQAHREIRESLGVTGLSITDVFRFPTLGALVKRVEALGPSAPAAPAAAPAPQPAPRAVVPQPTPQPHPIVQPAPLPVAANDRAGVRTEAMARRRALRQARGA
ncbi:MupA/Atu3671 family FMN-dependent luciferase-like monooxygenase [Mesobacterium pallidum]|uniref:MupA/Atu3671 family FMN-dependent luciferase-like monooxygenase n=1 Tax=Mesobacterium pallidum TaxID=2872037 RepID=UPI001EE17CCF|nr:MupA/Atu3671 family FMN-dependent luciferase-like monooxygenase [Mesobacterium pallidum]